jgi:CheY-like chemotaxis protein
MYAEYLRVCGFRVIACSDSRASISLARTCRPGIILLELRMNGMNGVEVLAELRKEPSLTTVPIVALTASVLSFETAAAMAAGFTELLPKPCFPEDLVGAITRLIGAPSVGRAHVDAAERADASDAHGGLRAGHNVVRRRRVASPADVAALSAQSPR